MPYINRCNVQAWTESSASLAIIQLKLLKCGTAIALLCKHTGVSAHNCVPGLLRKLLGMHVYHVSGHAPHADKPRLVPNKPSLVLNKPSLVPNKPSLVPW